MPELTRDELAALMRRESAARGGLDFDAIAEAILDECAVIPLAGVERVERNHMHAFGAHPESGYDAWRNGRVVESNKGYWDTDQGDDPIPAAAAIVLATREALQP